jgi:hypothetical protein
MVLLLCKTVRSIGDIKNGKIWIQHNGTEDPIASQLVAKGVPKEDIVLGFHSPNRRQYTGFAVN